MSNPRIGTQEFIALRGAIQSSAQTLVDITRPGTDGVAFRTTGKQAMTSELRSMRDAKDKADVLTIVKAYKGLVGTLQTVRDEEENVWTEVAVLGVSIVSIIAITTAAGYISDSAPSFLITAIWRVQVTNVD